MKLPTLSLFALILVNASLAMTDLCLTKVDELLGTLAVTVTVTAPINVKYMTCPRTSCTAAGQFSGGIKVLIDCFMDIDSGQTTTHSSDFWISLAYTTSEWVGVVPRC
ncbi:hypothetical protein BDN72DRAFT_835502 [Pluteus cervinus]|uniref:Uncharacterized protein n=1 Tax=Pluteus cervinus TaxID=181527 RepID=A0ACD3B7C7_9AGAR|nr:hypothetical protein BDN72DRAFT_835502 [Pluteus cervinus]